MYQFRRFKHEKNSDEIPTRMVATHYDPSILCVWNFRLNDPQSNTNIYIQYVDNYSLVVRYSHTDVTVHVTH
jgi:hypothetical protein